MKRKNKMKKLAMIVLASLAAQGAFASGGDKICKTNAEKYVKAFSRISFSILKEGREQITSTKLIQSARVSNGTLETYEVESYGSHSDPLHCTYQVNMLKNITNQCWAESIEEKSCGG